MQTLLKKVIADKLLKKLEYDIHSALTMRKGAASIVYLIGDRAVVCTLDCLKAPLLRHFDAVLYEHTVLVDVADMAAPGDEFLLPPQLFEHEAPGTGKRAWFGGTVKLPQVILPVFVFEAKVLEIILPGTPLYGPLRGQCEEARHIWDGSNTKLMRALPFGVAVTERAREFWPVVKRVKRLPLLHDVAEWALQQPDAGACIPSLHVNNFGLTKDGAVVPHGAVISLGVSAAIARVGLGANNEF